MAVPALGLSVDVPARALRLLQPMCGSTTLALPGFGCPASRGTSVNPIVLAARLLSSLDDLGLRHVVLLGHSASCQIVAEAAARAPERVSGLILIGPTTDPRGADWLRLAARWLRTAAWERPQQVPLLARDYRHTGPVAMARGMNAARHHRIDHALTRVRCPVLVVRGRHDHISPADWVTTLGILARRGRTVDLPSGAHMLPLTRPGQLAHCIDEFLLDLQ